MKDYIETLIIASAIACVLMTLIMVGPIYYASLDSKIAKEKTCAGKAILGMSQPWGNNSLLILALQACEKIDMAPALIINDYSEGVKD